jgi:hypothetical protein
MAISKENKKFIDTLIHYYISEASSYKQIAEDYVPEVESVVDTAFGIIVGNIYSEFMQACKNLKVIEEKIDVIEEKEGEIKAKLDEMEAKIDEIEEKENSEKAESSDDEEKNRILY